MHPLFPRAVALLLALCLAGPAALAETEAEKRDRLERERKAREQALFGNIGKVADAQTDITKNAQLGNRNASVISNLLGRNSIRSGLRHIRHGRSTMNRPEVRLGYFEVAQGILGLLAAANAAKLSDISGGRAAGLHGQGGVAGPPGSGAPGGDPAGVSGASGQSAASRAESWKQIASDLETDDTKAAFKEIEEEYGITKKELLAELRAGRDGVDLLENARSNAEARDDALAALKEAREKAEKAAAAQAPTPEGGGRSLASLGAPVPAGEAQAGDPAYYAAAVKSRNGIREELKRRLADMPDELEGELSPEVREALRAQEAERAAAALREARVHYTLFDMVRAKYAEREGMIRGWIKSPSRYEEN